MKGLGVSFKGWGILHYKYIAENNQQDISGRCAKGYLYRIRSYNREFCVCGVLEGKKYNRPVTFHKPMYEVSVKQHGRR